MKKKTTYLVDDEIDLIEVIKLFWREKTQILSISIICGLAGYLYALFQPQMFKIEIQINNPPSQLFEPYNSLFEINPNPNPNNNIINPPNIMGQFISDFELKLLSSDNLEDFVEESGEFGNFKGYLKSKNISVKKYFENKFHKAKQGNEIIPNKFFLVFTKELDGDIFLYKYLEFTKKKTSFEIKKVLELSIENKIIVYENALEKAKIINLENPILRSLSSQSQVVNEPKDLFYKGSKILSQEIINLKKLLIKLKKEEFNFEVIVDKSLKSPVKEMSNSLYFAIALMLGLSLSLVIFFFKGILKNN
jgi:LPS O-antigen subunit length determinant protein (WzzB/FepE family)